MKKIILLFTLCVLISHVRSQNKAPEITLPENWTADSTGSSFTFDRYAVSNDIFYGINITIDSPIYAFTNNSQNWDELVTTREEIDSFVALHGLWNIQHGLNLFVVKKDGKYVIISVERDKKDKFTPKEVNVLMPLPRVFPLTALFVPRKKAL